MGDGNTFDTPISQYEYSEDIDTEITLIVTDATTGEQLSYILPISLPNTGCNAFIMFKACKLCGLFCCTT